MAQLAQLGESTPGMSSTRPPRFPVNPVHTPSAVGFGTHGVFHGGGGVMGGVTSWAELERKVGRR